MAASRGVLEATGQKIRAEIFLAIRLSQSLFLAAVSSSRSDAVTKFVHMSPFFLEVA